MALNNYNYSALRKINEGIIHAFERIDLRILIFLVLSLNFLSFTLSSNEEAYLPLARQFMDPAWMPHSFLFNEWPGNRLAFQWLTGLFLKYIDFEPFVFFARMFVFLLISVPVAAIFKKLQIKNIYALLVFQIYLLHQNYFAQEFIFGDFEAKSIAYIFVLTGVYFLLSNKYLLTVFFAAIASYFHILAGGWFFVLVFIYSFFYTKSISLLFKELLLFIVILLPFGIYLHEEISKTGAIINGINIDWVYVYFRNAHHLAPLSIKERVPEMLLQISITGLLFLCTILIFRKFKGVFLNKLYILNVIVFCMLFISLGISLVDKTGFLLKFYLFRFAALGCFLMYLYILTLMKLVRRLPELITSGFFIISFYLVVAAGISTYRDIFSPDPKQEYKELVKFVKQNTAADDVFLNLDDYELSFSRKSQREEFVVYKLVPGGGQKIYEWYIRVLERKKVADNLSQLVILKQKYKLDYLLSDHELETGEILNLVFSNNKYCLYKIN